MLAFTSTFTPLQAQIDMLAAMVAKFGLDFVMAAAILLAGVWASNRLASVLHKSLHKMHGDATFLSVISHVVKWGIRAVAFIFALGQVGVATASVLTLLGTAGLAVGLALQGTLQNVAAGLMLLLWRPFRVGDLIESSGAISGTVAEITLFTTHVIKLDGSMMFVPNGHLWSNPVTNLSALPHRMLTLQVLIARQDDIETGLAVLKRIIDADPRILKDPDATSWVAATDYTDLGTRLSLGAWVSHADFYPVRADLLRTIKPQLEAAGCTIPALPQALDAAAHPLRLQGREHNEPALPLHS